MDIRRRCTKCKFGNYHDKTHTLESSLKIRTSSKHTESYIDTRQSKPPTQRLVVGGRLETKVFLKISGSTLESFEDAPFPFPSSFFSFASHVPASHDARVRLYYLHPIILFSFDSVLLKEQPDPLGHHTLCHLSENIAFPDYWSW